MFTKRQTTTRTLLIWGIIILTPPVALAADNYFLPHGSNVWNVAGNWSLGHCPLAGEHVKVQVTSASPKIVTYNWTGISNYASVNLNGSGGLYAMVFQPELTLTTTNLYLATNGDAYYQIEGPAFLWVNDNLYTGYSGTSDGYFILDTVTDPSAGLYVGNICYVGYSAPGDFDHRNGLAEVDHLYVGQSDPGTYWLKGVSDTASVLTVNVNAVIGNAAEGTFEQTGGTFDQTGANGLFLGLNTGGVGTYNMKGGLLNCDHISIGWNGDGFFNHTNGLIEVANNIAIGCQGTHPNRAWYKISDDDGDPELLVGGDLLIGSQTLAKYEQLSGGTTVVDGNIEIWKGTTSPSDYSYLYMGLGADWLSAAALINHSGYFDQDGGEFEAWNGTNDSTSGMNLDNNAVCDIRYLTNNAGTIYLWRNAILRGPYAFGGNYWVCDFTNNATFQMGNASFNGGSFRGILTNYGTFKYYQGDFSTSSLINHGTFNQYADFTCRRLVNNANITIPSDRWINADGAGYANAVENNGNLSMSARAHIDVGNDSVLVNNGPMYAGAPGSDYAHIYGDMVNNNYLLPSLSSLPAGHLYVNGDFTASASAELRIRIHGTALNDYDRLSVQNTANLGGELDVRLTSGFVPALGDSFSVLGCSARNGVFGTHYLPTLPAGLAWDVNYHTYGLDLVVVEAGGQDTGDMNCDGAVNAYDIDGFICAVSPACDYEGLYPDCDRMLADCNGDGAVNAYDIDGFISLVGGGG
ncbi:MAG: hypothetical protein ABIG44_13475 [Planctomycetota bacterium]